MKKESLPYYGIDLFFSKSNGKLKYSDTNN